MSKRLGTIGLFFAWLCASGALLDTVQVFAWARMFADYSRTMPIGEAAIQTLDPDRPCAICTAVSRAREAGRHEPPAAAPAALEKLLLAHVQDEPFFFALTRPEWPEANSVLMLSWRTPVPVPPPRTSIRGFVG